MEDLKARDRSLGEEWLRLVKPSDRINPVPKPRYDLVVVGAGTAGLVSAGGAAVLGARVALIERDKMGGDCLNTGCVPSKALIHEARQAWTRRKLVPGFDTRDFFREAMVRVRAKRTRIAPHDSVKKLEDYGVDVFLGQAAFTGADSIEVAGQTLRFRRAVVATGGRASRPKIAGLESVPYHTNESIFEISDLPGSLIIIGGGPVGCEMGQTFQRLGTQVTIIQSAPRLLDKENEEASDVLTGQLIKEGVKVMLSARVGKIRQEAEKEGMKIEVIRVDFSHEDRSILEGEELGFAEAVLEKGSDRILGLSSFSKTIHPYPTRSEILRKLGDRYRLSRLTPALKKLLVMIIRR